MPGSARTCAKSRGNLSQYCAEMTRAAACKERHVPFGTSIPYVPELMRFWIDLGAAFLSVSNMYECFNIMSRRIVSEARSLSGK